MGTRFAVLGDPIEHSLSPALHRAGHVALGLRDLDYEATRVPAGGLAAHLMGCGPEWGGFSVTAPLKREALDLAEESTDIARLAGGANTLVRTAKGWRADNTDVAGAVAAITERCAEELHAGIILGGGATAASVGLALAELGVTRITLAARQPANAATAAEAIRRHRAHPTVAVGSLADVGADLGAGADVVVSTIPAAAQGPDLLALLLPARVVFEVTYNEWPTPLALAGAEAGAAVVSGLDLLVHQAVLQFTQFTGHQGPLAAMRAAGELALARR